MGTRNIATIEREGMIARVNKLLSKVGTIAKSDNYPRKHSDITDHCEPDELAMIILEDNPGALEAFNTLEEMVEYIRVAMAANYVFRAKPVLQII
jgi:hypothetical protein